MQMHKIGNLNAHDETMKEGYRKRKTKIKPRACYFYQHE